ncbi:MAG TPA: OmpH family outer membrane protein [Polyangiaceae bacterium LLY-WYZ-14_1]|jgi:outer membrane protein|nr:OmpH family outer membrane protein [Polyangiaceae bacterium LLY-WYZ-14_1]
MHLFRHAVTLTAALLVASVAPKVYAQVNIAVVDLQRALNETEDGRRAKAQLKRIFKQRQESLDAKQQELKQMKERIERQKNVLSKQKLAAELEEYQKAFVQLQQVYVEYQRELAAKEAQLTKGILERMATILRRIGQAEGYTLILERNEGGVMWVPSNKDITDDLIQRYNRGEGR